MSRSRSDSAAMPRLQEACRQSRAAMPGPNLPAALGLGLALALRLDVRGGVRNVRSNGADAGRLSRQNGGVGLGHDRLGRLVADAGAGLALGARDDLVRADDLGVGLGDDFALGQGLDIWLGDRVRLGHDNFGRVGDRDDLGHAVDSRFGDDGWDSLGFGDDDAGLARRVDGLELFRARGRSIGLRRRSICGRRFRLGLARSGNNHGTGSSKLWNC
ncbi:hypothetical protein IWX48DRAFT_629704 [Phyllosticta citricarpa]